MRVGQAHSIRGWLVWFAAVWLCADPALGQGTPGEAPAAPASSTAVREGTPAPGAGAGAGAEDDDERATKGALREALRSDNGVVTVWFLRALDDVTLFKEKGDGGKRIANTLKLQPSLPLRVTAEWSLLARAVFPIPSVEVPTRDGFDTDTGFGDVGLLLAGTTTQPDDRVVWAAGLTSTFPTADEKYFGWGKYTLGPAAALGYSGDTLIAGAVVQQFWSYAGSSHRDRVAFMDIQPVLRLRVDPRFDVGMSPNWQWNQVQHTWRLPLGGGFGTTVLLGDALPFRFQAEVYYDVIGEPEELAPGLTFRFSIFVILPRPQVLRQPVFD